MAAKAAQQRMGGADLAWLRMDDETNRLVITAVLSFDEPLDHARVEALVRDRLLRHARFAQRPRERALPFLGATWEPDPRFDLRNHLHHVALARPGDEAALRTLVSELASTPLDPARPLWQVHVVDGPGAGTTIVARLHHCIGDGVALVRVLLGLTDQGRDLAPEEVGVAPPHPHGARDLRRVVAGHLKSLWKILVLPRDPRSVLKGRLTGRKNAAWSRPVPLEEVRRIAHGLGVKLNDVCMAAMAGALREHLAALGAEAPASGLKALVPVYVRAERDTGLANRFGLVFAALPVEIGDPVERVRAMGARMGDIKHSPEPTLGLLVLGALGLSGRPVEWLGTRFFTSKATVMTTNVPGPPGEISVAGKPLRSMMVWAPVAGSLGIGVSFLTYQDELRLGVICDEGVVPDPVAIVARFEQELVRLGARLEQGRTNGEGRAWIT